MKKILTIAIPSYNAGKTLVKCLDSVCDESIIDSLDIIVVNDGSKDDTSSIAHKYEARYPNSIRVIDKENGGHGSGVNCGIENAVGKYFRVLDSDDWYDTEALAVFVKELETRNQDLLITGYSTVNEADGEKKTVRLSEVSFDTDYNICDIPNSKVYLRMPLMCIKTEILQSHNIRLQEKTYYVDEEFCLMPIPYIGSVRFFDIDLYQYLVGQANQSVAYKNRVKHIDDNIRVVYRLAEYYRDNVIGTENEPMYFERLVTSTLSIYQVACIYDDDKRHGRSVCKDFNSRLKEICPSLYSATGKKRFIFALLNRFGIGIKTYEKLLSARKKK